MSSVVAEISQISKKFCRNQKLSPLYATKDILRDVLCRRGSRKLRWGEFWGLNDVSFKIHRGEVLGVIGHNGAGKSTLLNLVAGNLRPTTGSIKLYSKNVVMLDHSGGLSPVLTGRENVLEQLCLFGMSLEEARSHVQAVTEFAELGEFIDSPVGVYSLGMRVRLAFAIYSRLKPDVFIVDEALNGGDIKFRRKFQTYLDHYIEQGGAILLASHDLCVVQEMCRRVILLNQGHFDCEGKPEIVIDRYVALQNGSGDERSADVPSQSNFLNDQTPQTNQNSKIICIDSVEITSTTESGIRPGGAMLVNVKCRSSEHVPDVLLGVEIGHATTFPLATISGGYDKKLSINEGDNEFCLYIDNLPLLPGKYKAAIAVVTRHGGIMMASRGYDDSLVTFDVQSDPHPGINMALWRNSVIHIEGNWKVKTPANTGV